MLVTDLVQQIPLGWYRGSGAVVARLDLITSPVPSMPRKFQMAMPDKMTAREGVRRIWNWFANRLGWRKGLRYNRVKKELCSTHSSGSRDRLPRLAMRSTK